MESRRDSSARRSDHDSHPEHEDYAGDGDEDNVEDERRTRILRGRTIMR